MAYVALLGHVVAHKTSLAHILYFETEREDIFAAVGRTGTVPGFCFCIGVPVNAECVLGRFLPSINYVLVFHPLGSTGRKRRDSPGENAMEVL